MASRFCSALAAVNARRPSFALGERSLTPSRYYSGDAPCHASGRLVIISGSEGDDAKRYQESQVDEALAAVARPPKPG